MIVTVTPNPSVDRTVVLDEVRLGEVNRGRRSWSEPSGKGVNVALALHAFGRPVRAVLPAGGHVGALLRRLLAERGLAVDVVPIAGEVRSNVSLAEPDGTVTKINEAGPALTDDEARHLLDAATAAVVDAAWLVGAGSLPSGLPASWYAELVDAGRRHGARVAVDSSGAALAEALAAGPDLVKPNADELAELTGTAARTIGDVVAAAETLRRRGAGAVLASLGADGAVLVDADGVLWGRAPVTDVVSTVGAGDAMLAGFLSVAGDRAQRLSAALRWGAAAVRQEGTLLSDTAFDEPCEVITSAAPDLAWPLRG